MLVVAIDCPYCLTKSASFELGEFKFSQLPKVGQKPKGCTHEAPGRCAACDGVVGVFFRVTRDGAPSESVSYPTRGLMNLYKGGSSQVECIGYLPAPPILETPEFAPDNVAKAYLEAEKALHAGAFGAAAGQYRKAVERAVAPFVEEKFKSKMLGQKLGNLENKGLLPDAMLDWIRVVKDDGNFAMHDDDRDFDSEEDIRPARDFARTLISYLYTMPERVRLAREAADKRENGN